MTPCTVEITAPARQDAKDVVGLGQRPLVAGVLGKLERPARPLQRQFVFPTALRDQTEVGVQAGLEPGWRSRRQSSLEVALGEVPFSQALVDATQLALDLRELALLAERGGRLVARERLRVLSEQGAQVPDGFVKARGVRVIQREGLQLDPT